MSKIEWCDITINPFIGCSHCSPGCENCYAERFAVRLSKNKRTAERYEGVVEGNRWSGAVRYFPYWYEKLPLKPKKIFLGSMGDIFHPSMKEEWIEEIFVHIDEEGRHVGHIFFLLTKRIERAKDICSHIPLSKNVWLGVTVCNQEEADKKIPILLQIPAAKRFISAEPLLSKIDIRKYLQGDNKLSWVICGGETGPNARPMHEAWAKGLRDQCLEAGISYFFKSWGEWCPYNQLSTAYKLAPRLDSFDKRILDSCPDKKDVTINVGKKQSGHLIDGVEYRQFPEA